MPDAGQLVRAVNISVPAPDGQAQQPVVVVDDGRVRVTAITVAHGHAVPALAYRFDTADGSIVFSGDTTVNDDLIALAHEADTLVHCVADLGYLERHGTTGTELRRMAGLHTDVTEVGASPSAHTSTSSSSPITSRPSRTRSARQNGRRARATFTGRTTAGRDGLRRVLSGTDPIDLVD